MLAFETLVSKETLATFDLDLSEWTEEDQSSLREHMILQCKENPDWSDYESKHACREEVYRILLTKFREEYGPLIQQIDSWIGIKEAYAKRIKLGRKGFHLFLAETLEFKEFCRRFYDELRTLYNIDDVGMHEQFQMMKSKEWDFGIYKEHLKRMRKEMSRK